MILIFTHIHTFSHIISHLSHTFTHLTTLQIFARLHRSSHISHFFTHLLTSLHTFAHLNTSSHIFHTPSHILLHLYTSSFARLHTSSHSANIASGRWQTGGNSPCVGRVCTDRTLLAGMSSTPETEGTAGKVDYFAHRVRSFEEL